MFWISIKRDRLTIWYAGVEVEKKGPWKEELPWPYRYTRWSKRTISLWRWSARLHLFIHSICVSAGWRIPNLDKPMKVEPFAGGKWLDGSSLCNPINIKRISQRSCAPKWAAHLSIPYKMALITFIAIDAWIWKKTKNTAVIGILNVPVIWNSEARSSIANYVAEHNTESSLRLTLNESTRDAGENHGQKE